MEEAPKFFHYSERLSDQPGAEGFRDYLYEGHKLSGKETLDILDSHRDHAENLKNKLPPDYSLKFGKLLSAKRFEDSPVYGELVDRINSLDDMNRMATKDLCRRFIPDIIERIQNKSNEFLLSDDQVDIKKRLKNTRVIFFDSYRFYAKIAQESLGPDTGGAYSPSEDVVYLSPLSPQNETLRNMTESGVDYQHAYLSTIATHEILHAASTNGFWVKAIPQAGKESLKLVEQYPRQVGLAVTRSDKTIRLTWLNEGITAYLTKEVVPKNLTGDKEFDIAVQKELQGIYANYQLRVRKILAKVPRSVLFGAYFNSNLFLELARLYRESFGLALSEEDASDSRK